MFVFINTYVDSLSSENLCCQQKELEQRRTKVAPSYLPCGCCGWWVGMSCEEAMLSSEEIKPVAISIVELGLAEGIS